MTTLLTALLAWLAPVYLGYCYGYIDDYRHPGSAWTECSYDAAPPPVDPALRAVIGTAWNWGPWAEEYELEHVVTAALAGKSTVVLNAHIGGDAWITLNEPGRIVDRSTFAPFKGGSPMYGIKGEMR